MLVKIANSEDPDQPAVRSSLIWVCAVCLCLLGRQLMFEILEKHLGYKNNYNIYSAYSDTMSPEHTYPICILPMLGNISCFCCCLLTYSKTRPNSALDLCRQCTLVCEQSICKVQIYRNEIRLHPNYTM